MKIETDREREINSALEEFELGSKEVKALILIWVERLAGDPGVFPQLEVEVTRKMMELAGYIAAGLLAQDSAEGPSMEEVAEVRRESREQGNPLKAPMRAYPVKAVMLSGLILCLRVFYCPSDKGSRERLPERGLVVEDTPPRGVHVELDKYGFGKGCSPGLQEEVARMICFYPSLEIVRKELARKGIEMDIKKIRRIGLEMGFGMLDGRRLMIAEWKEGILPVGEELRGKKVAVAIDGGRVRFRAEKRGRKTKFIPVWREPKMLIIYIMDDQGKKVAQSECWIDGTFQGADQLVELLAMHLHRLGAKYADQIEFVSDGAPWIWNRLDWVIDKVKIEKGKVS